MVESPNIDLESMSQEDKLNLIEALEVKADRIKFNRMEYFELYPWQKKLANLSDSSNQMMAMCANQIGKTTTGAAMANSRPAMIPRRP